MKHIEKRELWVNPNYEEFLKEMKLTPKETKSLKFKSKIEAVCLGDECCFSPRDPKGTSSVASS